ncbi:hypothetical protein OAR07_01720 [Flavobacteriaceae bacterium]|nr:hypothetical protein [Flavobacteriaceae bacterium]
MVRCVLIDYTLPNKGFFFYINGYNPNHPENAKRDRFRLYLKDGESIRRTAKLVDASTTFVQKVKKVALDKQLI